MTFGLVSAAAPCAAAVASAAAASVGLLAAAAFASGAAAAAAGGGGRAAAAMRCGTVRGPLDTGAAGAFSTALPAPNDTPPGTGGPAPDGAGGDPAAPALANGPERVCASLPYQNSVVSLDGRDCVRTIRGVIDSTISLLSRVVLVEPNSRPRIGMSPSPGICVALRWSLSWISPASTASRRP